MVCPRSQTYYSWKIHEDQVKRLKAEKGIQEKWQTYVVQHVVFSFDSEAKTNCLIWRLVLIAIGELNLWLLSVKFACVNCVTS